MKYIKALLLFLLIAVSGAFIYFKTQSLGDPNNYFNQVTRFEFGKYSILRTLFNFHNDGDARAYYLSGSAPLVIEVAQASNVSLDGTAFNQFVQEVKKYTARPVEIYNYDKFKSGTLSQTDLDNIVKQSRRHAFTGQPNLFIIYAEDFEKQSTEVGTTYEEYGIVLSDKRLREVTAKYPAALPQYIEATLLHEFGHQLGLKHNTETGCVMNAESSRPAEVGEFTGNYTPTDFCNFELQQLQAIKGAL